jgi:hypothetical protein
MPTKEEERVLPKKIETFDKSIKINILSELILLKTIFIELPKVRKLFS